MGMVRDAPSSRPSFLLFFRLVISRAAKSEELTMMSDTPTPRIAGFNVGGSMKFDGPPLGFGANGIVDGLTPGGRPAMAIGLIDIVCDGTTQRWIY